MKTLTEKILDIKIKKLESEETFNSILYIECLNLIGDTKKEMINREQYRTRLFAVRDKFKERYARE